jgi:hypothetical protein
LRGLDGARASSSNFAAYAASLSGWDTGEDAPTWSPLCFSGAGTVLDQITRHFQSLPPVAQVLILCVLSFVLVLQALERYEDQTFTAFSLALLALVLAWFAFAKAYSAVP